VSDLPRIITTNLVSVLPPTLRSPSSSDATPSSTIEFKVFHKSQSKKKGKKRNLVASASCSLAELLKKSEHAASAFLVIGLAFRDVYQSSATEIFCQISTFDSTVGRTASRSPAEGGLRTRLPFVSDSRHRQVSLLGGGRLSRLLRKSRLTIRVSVCLVRFPLWKKLMLDSSRRRILLFFFLLFLRLVFLQRVTKSIRVRFHSYPNIHNFITTINSSPPAKEA